MYRSDKAEGTIVYVGGLVGDVKKEDLEAEFEKFGTLNRVWVAFNPPGFAFVEFDKKEDAESAVDALHDSILLGSKVRVEISRGRGKGSRGGFPGRGASRGFVPRGGMGGDFAPRGRGGFRGRGDFGPGRGGRGDFGLGRGLGRGGYGNGRPYDQDEGLKPFRGGDMGGRFDDLEDMRRPEFGERDFLARRDFRDMEPRSFLPRDNGREFDGRRDFAVRDGGREFPQPRGSMGDYPDGRDYGGRDFGREVNGASYAGTRDYAEPLDRGYSGGRDMRGAARMAGPTRDYGPSVAGTREYGASTFHDAAPATRDFGPRDYQNERDLGMRREAVRDFNPPRDLGGPREFGARPSRVDYAEADRYGGYGDADVRRAPDFDGGRFAGSGDYAGYGARDRFRSRSPIPRGSRPLY